MDSNKGDFMARDDLDLSAKLGYLLRAVEDLTAESRLLRNDLKAHMEAELEVKTIMDERIQTLENDKSRVKGYLMAVATIGGGIGTLVGMILGQIINKLI